MVSSNKLLVLLFVSYVLLSISCQSVEGQGLPGIRWGRGFQDDDVIQRGSKGKLWRLMNRKVNHPHQLNGNKKNCDEYI